MTLWTFNLLKPSLFAFNCALVLSTHLSQMLSNQVLFKSNVHIHPQIWCAFAPSSHSNQVLFNSNVPLHIQITQIRSSLILVCLSTPIKLSSTPMCFCTLESLKWSPLELKFAFPTSNHLNQAFPQLTRAFAPSNHSNEALFKPYNPEHLTNTI